jgi:uncharacterized flavoprotein (TIGR03862 family)
MPIEDVRQKTAAVVGAGPAGLMAAQVLAEAGATVTVYDRMPSSGRKFLMAGRGGLNLTHSEAFERFVSRYGPASARMRPFLDDFPPEALRQWAAGFGQTTFVGSSGRVFPEAFKASPLLRAWLGELDRLGVQFAFRHRFIGWEDGRIVFTAPEGNVRTEPSCVILALGGASWPRLGSDGGWTGLLEREGVELAPLRPANMGFTIPWSEVFRDRFAGVPLKGVALQAEGVMARGEAMIARNGIEGGAIYALSAFLRDTIEAKGEARLLVDLRPDMTAERLARKLGVPRKGETISGRLRKAGLAPVAVGLMREARAALPTDASELAALIKAVPLTLSGVNSIERAISSAGGVRFEAVDANLMLKARLGVFVAGEMLDWEAPTGGYLLQACFATGRAAAKGALAWMVPH